MPLKVWPNTTLGCNHQSICMPQLQLLCSAALVPMYYPRGVKVPVTVRVQEWPYECDQRKLLLLLLFISFISLFLEKPEPGQGVIFGAWWDLWAKCESIEVYRGWNTETSNRGCQRVKPEIDRGCESPEYCGQSPRVSRAKAEMKRSGEGLGRVWGGALWPPQKTPQNFFFQIHHQQDNQKLRKGSNRRTSYMNVRLYIYSKYIISKFSEWIWNFT